MNEQIVSSLCEQIAFLLSEFSRSRELSHLLKAFRALTDLREDYRYNPEAFGPHLSRLKDLGNRVREELCLRADEIAASFQGLISRQDAIASACVIYKEAIKEISLARGGKKESFAEGRITANRVETLALPEAGSKPRELLDVFLKERGLWDQASQVSSSKLMRLLKNEAVPEPDREALRKLCTPKESYRINVTRPSRQAREEDVWAEARGDSALPQEIAALEKE